MPRKKRSSTIELGTYGLRHAGGNILEEWHPRLKGTKKNKIYEEMRDNDPTIGSILYNIEAYLRRVTWTAKGPDAEEEDFLASNMEDMEVPWEDFISDVLSMLPFGFSLHEIVYKFRKGNSDNPRFRSNYTDGRIGWRNMAIRGQTTIDHWEIDEETAEILGVYQQDPSSFGSELIYIPSSRFVLFRTKPYKNNPEGVSVLRSIYRPWYMKKRLEEIEAIGIQRDAAGIPVVEVPPTVMSPSASQAHKNTRSEMEKLVSQIHADERQGIVFPAERDSEDKPTGYKLRLLSSPGPKQVPADPVIRRYDSRIAMALAAEFLMLGTEKTGSFGLATNKSTNFLKSLEWYINTIAATLNKGPVTKLYDANGVPIEKRAKLVPSDIEQPDIRDLGLFLSQVAAGGFLHPTPALEHRIREIADLPLEPDEVEAIFEEEKAIEEEQRNITMEGQKMGIEGQKASIEATKNPQPVTESGKPPQRASAKTQPSQARPNNDSAKK